MSKLPYKTFFVLHFFCNNVFIINKGQFTPPPPSPALALFFFFLTNDF